MPDTRRRKPKTTPSTNANPQATWSGKSIDSGAAARQPVRLLALGPIVLNGTGAFGKHAVLIITALSGFIFWVIFALNGDGKLWNPTPNTQNASALLTGDTSPFFVADLPGRGKGLIASRDIEQGELLLREKPLFVVPRQISSSPTALISGLLAKLSEDEQAAFYNLSYVNFPRHLDPDNHRDEVSLAIFQTNAVAAGDGAGIFPKMARINHGCSSAFNVVYTWREKEGALYVHALKSIDQGHELLTSYTNSKRSRHDRRAFLAEHYGFECQCSVCSLSSAESRASDARLGAISEAYEQFAKWGEGRISGPEAVAQVRKIWALENEEGYWSERGRLAADAAWVAASHSDAAATREWAEIATEWYSYEVGADSEQVGEMEAVVRQPENHQAWGTRKLVEVGGLGDKRA